MVVFLDLKSKAVREYTIDKDPAGAHFSIYIKKYESKKERIERLRSIMTG